jgi:hypothetical protein
MLFSSVLSRTLASTVLAYAFAILLNFGLPFLMLVFSGLFGIAYSGSAGGPSLATELALLIGGWLLVSLNPLATAAATELILIEQQNAFYFSQPLSSGVTVSLPSPWIVYCLVYLLFSLLLLWLSVRLVRRVEK